MVIDQPIIQRILIVDDDEDIRRLVKDKFEREGFDVFSAIHGQDALQVIDRYGLPHLAIVDLNMPEMNGFEFCERVLSFVDLPIIMLTAVDEEDKVVQGIEQYAEDYVIKPFSPRELVARARRILRRIGDFAYTLDVLTPIDQQLTVDFAHQKVEVQGESISLTPIETKLLYILIKNAGHTVTSDFLLRRLWPMEEVFESSLRVHVHRLRHKVEPQPSRPKYIVTQRGLGYSFPVLAK